MPMPKEKELTLGQALSWNRRVAREREQMYDAKTRELNPDASETFAGYRKRVNDADVAGARFEETQKLEQAMGSRGRWDFSNDGGYTTLWWKGRDATGRMTKIAYKKAKGSHGVGDFFSNPDLKLEEDWTPERHARAMKLILGENSKYAMTGQERQAKNLLDQTKRDLKMGGWKPAAGWANEFKPLPEALEATPEESDTPITEEDSPLGGGWITKREWDRAENAGVLNQLLLNKIKYFKDAQGAFGTDSKLRTAIREYMRKGVQAKLRSEAPAPSGAHHNRRARLQKFIDNDIFSSAGFLESFLERASKRKGKPVSVSKFGEWAKLPKYQRG